MKNAFLLVAAVIIAIPLQSVCAGQDALSAGQLQQMLESSPAADGNGDGILSLPEAIAFRKTMTDGAKKKGKNSQAIEKTSKVNPGWDLERFPDNAVCYKSPAEIKAIFETATPGKQPAVVSYPKPGDGALRVVGIGHSFMVPGYKTFPLISQAAGMKQPLYTHIGGGSTGSARYKWEQENGIFQFDGKPFPKLLSAISGGQWEAMMFAPYYHDRPAYYSCWIDFCLKYNPDMKFYLSDGWPQLAQFDEKPTSEEFFTEEVFEQLEEKRRVSFARFLDPLLKAYPDKVFVLPTSEAMVLAAKYCLRGQLPGIEGVHRVVGKKERSLWRDQIGHLGPGFERLEGYVFYSTLYGKSPEQIEDEIDFGGSKRFPSPELDRMFRKIAWQAVLNNPLSGVTAKSVRK